MPAGLIGKFASMVARALARVAWSVVVGLRFSVAGANRLKTGPNWATTVPAPSDRFCAGARNWPMSNWMSDGVLAARVGRWGAQARPSNIAICDPRNPAALALRAVRR